MINWPTIAGTHYKGHGQFYSCTLLQTIDVEIYKSIGADLGIEFEDDDEEGYEEEEEYYDESIQPYELVEPIETPGENRSWFQTI